MHTLSSQNTSTIEYVKKHQSLFRWIVFFVEIIFLLFIIKSYINYWNIEQAIIKEKQDTQKIQEHIYYLNNFQKKYLNSEYSQYLLWHENKRFFDKETIVYFVHWKKEQEKVKQKSKNLVKKKQPLEQRKKLIKQKMWYILQQ